MSVRRVQDYIAQLRRHADFLEERLEGKEESKSHYARKELNALRWIIEYTEDTELEAADHLTNYRERKRQWEK